jgi:tetratricopeptide (TPR) repeat protein
MKRIGIKFWLLVILSVFISVQAFSQKGIESGSPYGHGQDSINCVRNLSLFYEFYKHSNFKDAITPWRQVYKDCPAAREYIFGYGVEMYRNFLEKATEPALKAALLDTILMIDDARIKYFGDEGKILGSEGMDVLRYRRMDGPEYIKKGYDLLKKSIEIEKEKSTPAVLTTYITAGLSLLPNKLLTGEQVINDYVVALEILEAQLKRGPSSRSQQAKDIINSNVKDSKVLTCEAVVKIFNPKYTENKDNIPFLKLVSGFLKDSQCESENLFATISERLYDLEPSAESAYNLARLFFKRINYEKAKSYYLEAIKGATNDSDKANYYYELGIVYNGFLKQPQSAVECATDAVRLKSGWGEPYLLMGQAYLSGKNLFDDSFKQQTIFWIAVDMFQKAKSIDPSVAEKANSLIAEYSNYFPSKEEVFFQTLAVGQSYTIGGWINKTTTVRTR